MNATYSPEDNKLRLYAIARLSPELYARVKGAGFIWAPRQELFVAPAWTPGREDLLIELCGEIGDEDTSLVERAEERADRFDDYSNKRADDAEGARAVVERIADGIPLGQPILVGHHSERHARRDAEKIENGMRKAVRLWETAGYWKLRAAGAIRNAKYKELPEVRAHRIKTIEADKRKQERAKAEAEKFTALWLKDALTWERARAIANYDSMHYRSFPLTEYPRAEGASTYEGAMSLWSALEGIINAEQARDLAVKGHARTIESASRWIAHYENSLAYERAMLGESGGTAADKVKPEKGGACKCWVRSGWIEIQKVNKVSVTVLDNWGNGGADFTRTIPFDKLAAVLPKAEWEAMKAGYVQPARFTREEGEKAPKTSEGPTVFDAMKDAIKAGVQVVAAPQLFPTPPEIARQVVELADLRPGQNVLEPSAGTGRLLDAIAKAGGGVNVYAVEINAALAEALRGRVTDYRCADFLSLNGELGAFDRIVMNPPFVNGADIRHIEHARAKLKPGGRLVAICANGPRQRAALEPIASEWIDLPAGSFSEQGTNVNAAIVVIDA